MSSKSKKVIVAVTILTIFISLIAGWKLTSSHVIYIAAASGARDAKRIGDLQNFRMALMLYHAEHDAYPSRLTELVPRYLSEIPLDPLEGELHRNSACESAIGESSFSYRYALAESGNEFAMAACLEEGKTLTISPYE